MTMRRVLVSVLSYALTGVTLAATLAWVGFLIVASTFLLPFDIAYRAASERLKG